MTEDLEKTAIGTIGPSTGSGCTAESTQMMTAPGAEATQYAANVECPVCRTASPPSEIYCIDCGFVLSSEPGVAVEIPESPSIGSLVTADGTREFALKPGENTVGRQDADILLMHNTVSRKHAAVFVEDTGVFVEDLGSTNGTTVDGRKLSPNDRVELSDGAEVVFGSQALAFHAGVGCQVTGVGEGEAPSEPECIAQVSAESEETVEETTAGEDAPAEPEPATEEPKPVPVATLVAATGDLRFDLFTGTTTIGRRDGNDIVVPDPYVSGRHAEIETAGEETGVGDEDSVPRHLTPDTRHLILTDLGSTNGTMVNGVRLEPNAPREVQVGDEITFGQTVFKIEAIP